MTVSLGSWIMVSVVMRCTCLCLQTKFEVTDGKLVQRQFGKVPSTITRELQDDNTMITVSISQHSTSSALCPTQLCWNYKQHVCLSVCLSVYYVLVLT